MTPSWSNRSGATTCASKAWSSNASTVPTVCPRLCAPSAPDRSADSACSSTMSSPARRSRGWRARPVAPDPGRCSSSAIPTSTSGRPSARPCSASTRGRRSRAARPGRKVSARRWAGRTRRRPTSGLPGCGSARPFGRTPTSSRPSCAPSRSSWTSSPADVHRTASCCVLTGRGGAGVTDRDETFSAFVAARSPHLLRTAYLLTGDRGQAEDLVQTALAKTYLAWDRIADIDAVETYVRRTMVTTNISWWRRRRVREVTRRRGSRRPDLGRRGRARCRARVALATPRGTAAQAKNGTGASLLGRTFGSRDRLRDEMRPGNRQDPCGARPRRSPGEPHGCSDAGCERR